MITIPEKAMILAIAGEDESGNLLDTCEAYFVQENAWRIISTLNNKGKNLGLCKFVKVNTTTHEKSFIIYAFGQTFIEKLDLQLKPADQKWQVVNMNSTMKLNTSSISI